MSEITENAVQNASPQGQAGGGMSPEMANKLEALGIGHKNVAQTPAMEELGNAITERANTEQSQEINTQNTQAPEVPQEQGSYADQILQDPKPEVATQAAPQEVPNPNIASEADALQASQNPSNDNEYYKLDSELFGGQMEIGKKAEESSDQRSFNGFEDFTPFLKEEFGFENVNDFVSDYQKKREIENDYNNAKTQLDRVQHDINSLPIEITQAIQAWSQGEDYTKPFSQKRLNYNLEAKDLGQDKLIGHYFPEDFKTISSEEFKERLSDGDVVAQNYVQKLYNDADRMFNDEKMSVKTQASEQIKMAEERGRKFNESVLHAMDNFDKKYPNSTRVYRDKVHRALLNGELQNLMFNADGSYTDKAAELYVEMTQGEDLRNQLIRQAEERATSRANEQIISRQSGSPRLRGGGAPESEVRPEVQKYIDEITKGGELNKNVY